MDMDLYLENRRKYLENRSRFPLDELSIYRGAWIAWSPDGTRIVATSNDMDDIERLIRTAGEDPMYCVVEGIPEFETMLGDLRAESS